MSTTYAYKVRDKAGAVHKGNIEGQSEQLVVAKLRELGYVPVSVTSQGKSKLSADVAVRSGGDKIGLRDIVIFSRQLATMVGAGLTLIRALGILADQTESKPLAEVIRTMRSDIEKDCRSHQAISSIRRRFPGVHRDDPLRRGRRDDRSCAAPATMLEAQLELRRRVSRRCRTIAVGGIIVSSSRRCCCSSCPCSRRVQGLGELPLPTKVLIALSASSPAGGG